MTHKQLTPHNWSEPDPVSENFGRRAITGLVQMDGNDWARHFLAEELKPHVPQEIRELFEVARGALVYGWFFYPLFELGQEQLYRVSEAAAKACYRELQGPEEVPNFKRAVDWLAARRVIRADEARTWEAVRELRNMTSHPSRQPVMPPGQALKTLRVTAHNINLVFLRTGRLAPISDDSR